MTTVPASGIGDAVTSGGITLRVESVERRPQLVYATGVNEHDAGDVVAAGDGAEFVVVRTQITNDTAAAIDLTCGYPVDFKLVDDRDRAYTPGEELYALVADNPECNADTNPGFTVPMTWYFKVPSGTAATAVRFSDVTDFGIEQPTRVIRLG